MLFRSSLLLVAKIELKIDSLLSARLKDNGPQSTSVRPVVVIGFTVGAAVPALQGLPPGDVGGDVDEGVDDPDMIPETSSQKTLSMLSL